MSRPLRLDHAGAVWHVTSRGNERREIFRDDNDRNRFLAILLRVIDVFRWQLHAYVLMGNHYHLLLETPEPTLCRGMQHLNGLYTRSFNRRHDRCGHLLQGRFKAILVERNAHLLELARYVVLNPVRAGIVESPEKWTWSNYRATAGLIPRPAWLEVRWTLAQFGSSAHSRRLYQAFVEQGKTSSYAPWPQVVGQIYLGAPPTRGKVRDSVKRSFSREFPRPQRLPFRSSLERLISETVAEFGISKRDLLLKRRTSARLAFACLARTEAVFKLREYADCLGVRERAASGLAAAGESLLARDPRFRRHLEAIRVRLGRNALGDPASTS